MTRWLSATLLMLGAVGCAGAAELPCDWRTSGPHYTEWVEAGELRGARILLVDPKWQLSDPYHSTIIASCETCDGDRISSAYIWFGVRDAASADLEQAISAESVAVLMAALKFPPAEFSAKTDSVAMAIGGLPGRARRMGVRSPDGHSAEVIALAAAKDCLGVFAILAARGGVEIPIDRMGAFLSAFVLDRYRATPAPDLPK